MAVVARGHRFRTGRLGYEAPSSPIPTEPESSPLRLDRRHLRRISSIPTRYRDSASNVSAGLAPEVPSQAVVVPGRELKKWTSSPGRFL